MDKWLSDNLVCPRDKGRLLISGESLICSAGHRYPVIDDVPIMLLNDVEQTLWVADASITKSKECVREHYPDNYYIDTLGISEKEKEAVSQEIKKYRSIDPVVKYIIAATSGHLYRSLIGKLNSYPIPDLPLPHGNSKIFLDVGCNWGRWCVAAGRKGYLPIGIDPSIGAVMAARRVCAELRIKAEFVVADARYMPFANDLFDVVFSYSVLQHFSRENVRLTLKEINRVLKNSGLSLIQMPNRYGVRSLYHQLRRRFREAEKFEVRYWYPSELKETFGKLIGKTSLSVDGYFGLGIQEDNLNLLPRGHRLIIRASEALRTISRHNRFMLYFADSIYVKSSSGNNGLK